MKYDELILISDETMELVFWDYWSDWPAENAEYYRLMWNMCRDHHDKALMMDAWNNRTVSNQADIKYQERMMNTCIPIVAKYMSEAPTWNEVRDWTHPSAWGVAPRWIDNHLIY